MKRDLIAEGETRVRSQGFIIKAAKGFSVTTRLEAGKSPVVIVWVAVSRAIEILQRHLRLLSLNHIVKGV